MLISHTSITLKLFRNQQTTPLTIFGNHHLEQLLSVCADSIITKPRIAETDVCDGQYGTVCCFFFSGERRAGVRDALVMRILRHNW